MNDRFKFRIAVYERQQNNMPWAFVEYIDPDNQHWGLNQCGDIISDSNYSAHYTRKNAPDSVHRVYEVEQCTGLKDKNGKLIYEGDIIHEVDKEADIDDVSQIVWNQDTCHFMKLDLPDTKLNRHCLICEADSPYIEIIGNIHEQAKQKDKK